MRSQLLKREQVGVTLTKQNCDLISRAVATLDPDNLGRMAVHKTPLVEVCVLRHDDESLSNRVGPDCVVVGSLQAFVPDVVEPGCRSTRRATKRGERF